MNVEDIELAIYSIYRRAYRDYLDGRVKSLPRLDPGQGQLGQLWRAWDASAPSVSEDASEASGEGGARTRASAPSVSEDASEASGDE